MNERDWGELDERLDRAIDALNAEHAPEQAEGDDPQFAELVDTARLVRRLRAQPEAEADFPARLARAVVAQASGTVAPTILPNGHVEMARRPVDPSRRRVRLLLVQLAAVLRVIGVCVLAGMIAGGVVGGIGGRAAMRVSGYLFEREFPGLVVTTESSGEVVGRITLDGTLSLIIEMVLFYGLPGGLLYLLVAPWLPRTPALRGLAFGGVQLALAGAFVITSDNSDFRRLGSPVLNVAMFAAIIFGYGLAVAALADWLTGVAQGESARGGRRAGVVAVRLATLGFGFVGAFVLLLVPLVLVAAMGASLTSIPLFLAFLVVLPLARLAVALPEVGLAERFGGLGRVRRFALLALGLAMMVTLAQLLAEVVAILTGP